MKRPAKIHWGMAGIGIPLVIAGLATPDISAGSKIGICGLGSVFVMLAMGWPQRLAESAIRAFGERIRKTHHEHDTAAASQLLREAVDELSDLPLREANEMPGVGFLASVKKSRAQPEAVALYERQHRATTVHAISAGLSVGAKDNGALQLAQSASDIADLLELKAELLRMVVELTPSSR